MKTKYPPSIEQLKAALNLTHPDALGLVEEFRKYEHGCQPGTYVALVFNPGTGETRLVNEPSRSWSTDEYFGESGVLSDITLLSNTRAHWSPSPDDGFEWRDGNDYVCQQGDPGSWITAERYREMPEDQQRQYTEWFSVSDNPVDGWVPEGWGDHQVVELDKRLDDLRAAIQEEIERIG